MDRAKNCKCIESKCVKEIQELPTEDEDDDEDFIYFHCTFCHDIALGKTNFHCDECGHWVCQSCTNSTTNTIFKNGVVCPECYKKPKFLHYKKRKMSNTTKTKVKK